MAIAESRLKKLVSDAIKKTVNKFRECPRLFFTETDIHAYFYHCLYSTRLEVKTGDGVLTTCLHKEYPTNFRYTKKDMKDYGLEKEGDRGNYDLAILNPKFIQKNDIKNVINKDVRNVITRRSKNPETFRRELIAAIEFKYVINNSKNFIQAVEKDAKKLSHGRKYQDFEAYNLVFCNRRYEYLDKLKEKIKEFDPKVVKNLLIISYYDGFKKVTPKPFANEWIL